ncbi:MAG: ArsB/NhaD family transporter [Desulfomonile tiedjei]|nr:ArsB/NhaD family transporter [Desulfomonile tiedjei]
MISMADVSRSEELAPPIAVLILQGSVEDATGSPLDEVRLEVFADGRPFVMNDSASAGGRARMKPETGDNGLFQIRIHAPPDTVRNTKWSLQFQKPAFKTSPPVEAVGIVDQGVDAKGIHHFTGQFKVTLQRDVGASFWIALAVLVGIYALISLELMHRTLAALLGAAVLLAITHTAGHFDPAYQVLTFHQCLKAVDWNVIFLLMGMMVVVGVLKESGVFQWMAYMSFRLTGGKTFLLAALLCVITAVLSAFLDNVTTMLLLTPVTIELSVILRVSPFALLLPEIMASNFGGTSTLIGDPPNIMIGSYAGLTFNDFLMSLGPVVFVTMVAQILYTRWYYGREYGEAKVEKVADLVGFLKEKYRITDARLLWVGSTVLLGVIVLFLLHGALHMEVSVAALLGAALILLLSGSDIVHVLERDVEWSSLVFFIMLFIIVGAAEQTGILQYVADRLMWVCKGNLVLAILFILWISAILSAIVDNIPFTATMLPVVAFLSKSIPGAESGVLWWALALGACFGGNGTIIGASANVIAVGLAEKSGYRITFYEFLKHGAPVTCISLVIASVWLLLVLR